MAKVHLVHLASLGSLHMVLRMLDEGNGTTKRKFNHWGRITTARHDKYIVNTLCLLDFFLRRSPFALFCFCRKQIGWATPEAKYDNEKLYGVGDNEHSWAYCGKRHLKYNCGESLLEAACMGRGSPTVLIDVLHPHCVSRPRNHSKRHVVRGIWSAVQKE